MPCNLAVTITKAAVKDENLKKLLTPDVVEAALRAYAQQKGITELKGSWTRNSYYELGQNAQGAPMYYDLKRDTNGARGYKAGAVTLRIGGDWGFDVIVDGGTVRLSTTTTQQGDWAKQVTEEVTKMLADGAGTLFAAQIAQAIQQGLGAAVAAQQVQVESEGQQQQATVLTFRL